MRSKEQNVVYLTGWIVAAHWRQELRNNKPVLEVTLRSDERRFGGHHQVLLQGELALGLQAVLDVLEVQRQQQRWRRPGLDELDQVTSERLGELFPEVMLIGSLGGNDVRAESVRYLNLTSQQRSAAKAHLQCQMPSSSVAVRAS